MAFSDNFNRANESLEASAFWTHDGLIPGACSIVSNQLHTFTSEPSGSAYKCPDQGTANHFVSYVVANIIGESGPFVCCRLADRNNFVGVRNHQGALHVYKRNSGSLVALYSVEHGIQIGDLIRLETVDDTWTVKLNGATVASGLIGDATLVSTRQGVVSRSVSKEPWIDDFTAASIVTSGSESTVNYGWSRPNKDGVQRVEIAKVDAAFVAADAKVSEIDTALATQIATFNAHTHSFAQITDKPTTISGYGITNAYTKTETDSNISTAVDAAVTELDVPSVRADVTSLAATVAANKKPKWKNLFVNANHLINQARYGVATAISGAWICDQWLFYKVGAAAVQAIQVQKRNSPKGTYYRSRIGVNTARGTLAAGDYLIFGHCIEMWRASPLMWGPNGGSNAKNLLIRFGFNASQAGTFSLAVKAFDQSRAYIQTFTVAPADVNKDLYYEFVIPPDNNPYWETIAHIQGFIRVYITLACGTASRTATVGSWVSGAFHAAASAAAATNAMSVIGQYELFDCEAYVDYWNLGIFPDWEEPAHDQNIMECERYYQKSYGLYVNPGTITTEGRHLWNAPGVGHYMTFPLRTRMRGAVSAQIYNPQSGAAAQYFDYSSGIARAYSGIGDHWETSISWTLTAGGVGFTLGAHWIASSILA